MERLATLKSYFTINRRMLPIKVHFLFYALATSAVMPFFPLIVKSIGIKATGLGIMYTVAPFLSILANPLFGWAADKLKRVKLVIIVLIFIQTPFYMGLTFMPPIETEKLLFSVKLTCSADKYYILKTQSTLAQNKSLTCEVDCDNCNLLQTNGNIQNFTLCRSNITFVTTSLVSNTDIFLQVLNMSIDGNQLPAYCIKETKEYCQTKCFLGDTITEEYNRMFSTYQYWTVLFLKVASLVSVNAAIALGDAACYEALEGKVNDFGIQRVWMSIGWGFGGIVSGYIIDVMNPNNDEKVDFSYNAYCMLVLIIFDVIALSQATLRKPPASKHIFKDVGKIFTKLHPIFFALAILMVGMCDSIQNNYLFWYLEDLGASKLLIGLAIAVICLVMEAPFLFFSGGIIKKIGRDNSMVIVIGAYGIWFLAVSLIHNPWWILPTQLLQGPTYGLFIAAVSSYGKVVTSPGTEATIQTVLGAIHHGFGIGIGSLLGGVGVDFCGARMTFRFCGFFAVGIAIMYKLITAFVAGESTAIYKGDGEPTDNESTGNDNKVLPMKEPFK